MSETSIIYNAAIYVRLSKEDGDKEESNSIVNQKELIHKYLNSKPEIHIYSERIDDGYSGVDFDRPAFHAMMEDIKENKINCIVVKDLSRFGRNYIEVGRYLEKLFPFIGVRFIAINDNYDSAVQRSQSDNIIIPFMNLLNDAYCRDISIKIRSQLDIKRRNGDFISSFAPYGYQKSPENKNKLIVDEYASGIVKDIFAWKIDGSSNQSIADKLNSLGILSPMEYKHSKGLKFETSFRIKEKSIWTPVSVGRILKNEIYLGVLQQGKGETPNYKVKKRIEKNKSEWIRVEDAHESIISKETFKIVNQLLKADTRTSPMKDKVYLFAGLLYCGDCNQSMVRKMVSNKEKQYFYYVCSTNKYNKSCSTHCIKEELVKEAVFFSLKRRIENIMDIENALGVIDELPFAQVEVKRKQSQLQTAENEKERFKKLILSLYEDLSDGILDKDEYLELKAGYKRRENEVNKALIQLKQEYDNQVLITKINNEWIERYKEHRDITGLNRKIVMHFIYNIKIYENNRVEVTFLHQNEFAITKNLIADSAVFHTTDRNKASQEKDKASQEKDKASQEKDKASQGEG